MVNGIRRIGWAVLVLALVLAAGTGVAEAKKKKAGKAAAPVVETAPTAEQMAEAWASYAAPGEHHKHLEQLAGQWIVRGRVWMTPDSEPVEFHGGAVHEMIMGGRFLEQNYKGEMAQQVVIGKGIDGYDNQAGQYVGTWIDSMGTVMMLSHGKCEKDGAIRTMHGSFVDPATGKTLKTKGTIRIKSTVMHTFEFWQEKSPAGDYFKSMEIIYSRSS